MLSEVSCAIPDCGRPEWAFGLCSPHYIRRNRGSSYGEPISRPTPGSRLGKQGQYIKNLYSSHAAKCRDRGRAACDYELFSKTSLLPCVYCGERPTETSVSSVDRIDSRLSYDLSNVQPLCKSCNYLKGRIERALFSCTTFMNASLEDKTPDHRSRILSIALKQYDGIFKLTASRAVDTATTNIGTKDNDNGKEE